MNASYVGDLKSRLFRDVQVIKLLQRCGAAALKSVGAADTITPHS